MLTSLRFGLGSLLVSSLVAGCVFDAHGTRQDTTSTGQGGSATSSSVSSGGSGPSSTTVGSGGNGPVCGDGVVEPPETCETGSASFPSCQACKIVAQCGNNVIDPGEACDETSADCTSCQVTAGKCFNAEKLTLSLAPVASTSVGSTITLPGAFSDTQMCGGAQPRAVKLFRYDVGPYPNGLFISATGDGGTFNDAVIWRYAGCALASSACNDIDPDPLGVANNTAFLAIPPQAPGSVIFLAIGDWGSQTGAFHYIATPMRYFEDLEGSLGQLVPTGSWVTSTHFASMSNPAAKATLESPDIDVVGIHNLQIALVQNLSTGAMATAVVTPDGGAPTVSASIPDTAGAVAGRAVTVTLPPGTKSAKVRLEMAAGTGYWEIHRVVVGEVP